MDIGSWVEAEADYEFHHVHIPRHLSNTNSDPTP